MQGKARTAASEVAALEQRAAKHKAEVEAARHAVEVGAWTGTGIMGM
jgi:hypothetical protein